MAGLEKRKTEIRVTLLNFKLAPLAAKSYRQLGFVTLEAPKTTTIIKNTGEYGEIW